MPPSFESTHAFAAAIVSNVFLYLQSPSFGSNTVNVRGVDASVIEEFFVVFSVFPEFECLPVLLGWGSSPG